MDVSDYYDNMVQPQADVETQIVVYDKTPGTQQKKINIVVRSHYTVGQVINDINVQYGYDSFDLVFQPSSTVAGDLVYLNDRATALMYNIEGFNPQQKNTLVLLPTGLWDRDVKKRYDLTLKSSATTTEATMPIAAAATTEMAYNYIKIKGNVSSNCVSSSSNNNNNNNSMHSNHTNNNNNQATAAAAANYVFAKIKDDSTTIGTDTLGFAGLPSPPSTLTTMTTTTTTSATDSPNFSPLSDTEPESDDDLVLGASASPTETEPMNNGNALKYFLSDTVYPIYPSFHRYGDTTKTSSIEADLPYQEAAPPTEAVTTPSYISEKSPLPDDDLNSPNFYLDPNPRLPGEAAAAASSTSTATTTSGATRHYVGLVNQAMTCYLNSLLQALYMTPEFRNALYRWEVNQENESKNIPYQLQKLFLNLQTSKKSAVETTDLTRSFGWDSTEAWQQHDIQELCRVMFDALETRFKNVKQANLISSLYEGKMLDYVKCLECNTEKTRADTFLDIPLPVRPFGSTVAYGSIEEALRAFVQPETLDGNNQYFCEKCNKKCDAHKGLKFKYFPYILTLHLKRFDFDYQTMHRIKLNDKVTFPQTLNLNSFINATEVPTVNGSGATATHATADDCSTTDSGSAMEEDNCSSGIATTASSQHENEMNDDDEGIDMSSSTDPRSNNAACNNAAVQQRLKHDFGPYLYELYAIMIHSGSASGGHYYAYIKEFDNNEWFCFNDQSVTPITQEDIQKSFGGGSSKAYYSSVYSSSTNAYMLMYRQINPKRNEPSMKSEDFPEPITALWARLRAEDEMHAATRNLLAVSTVPDLNKDIARPRVYFYNPALKKMKSTRVRIARNFDLQTVLESAFQMLEVEQFAPIENCRLVIFNKPNEEIIQSFENVSNPAEVFEAQEFNNEETLDFLLEYRLDGQEFEIYKPGGVTWNACMVNVATMEMDGPYLVYSRTEKCDDVLRHSIAVRLHVKEDELLLATLDDSRALVAYDPWPTEEAQANFQAIVNEQFSKITYLYVNVPNTDLVNLEIIGIPSYEAQLHTTTPSIEVSSDVVDAVRMNDMTPTNSADYIDPVASYVKAVKHYTASITGAGSETPKTSRSGHESNSEDSSLSDGDRTLVESIQNRGGGDSQISSSSHSPQLSSPDDDLSSYFNGDTDVSSTAPTHSSNNNNNNNNNSSSSNQKHFFHAFKLDVDDSRYSRDLQRGNEDLARTPVCSYKILADASMTLGTFKRHLEKLIHVPAHCFRLTQRYECGDLNDPHRPLTCFIPGDTVNVELGKLLQPDERKAKVYFMRLSELNNESGKLNAVCDWVYNESWIVAEAKRDLIAKMQRIDSVRYRTLTMDNCRLWLKGGRSLVKILADRRLVVDELESAVVSAELLIQEVDDGVPTQTDEDSLTIFVRRWHTDKLEFGPFQEVTLDKNNELRQELTKLSDIPIENIAYCKINSSFPCTNISLLSVNGSMSWFKIPATLDKYPLTSTLNGCVYFYKDDTVQPVELTTEERRELSAKEKARLDRLGCIQTSLYSPRRERALKIYVDTPETTTTTTSATTTGTSASLSAPATQMDAQSTQK